MKGISQKEAQEAHNKRQKKFREQDINRVLNSEKNLKSKFGHGKLQKYVDDFRVLMSMIKDYANGTYKQVPWNIIASIGGALIYVLMPLDLIPDFILGLGYLDDAAVLSICLNLVGTDVEKYKKWKEAQDKTS